MADNIIYKGSIDNIQEIKEVLLKLCDWIYQVESTSKGLNAVGQIKIPLNSNMQYDVGNNTVKNDKGLGIHQLMGFNLAPYIDTLVIDSTFEQGQLLNTMKYEIFSKAGIVPEGPAVADLSSYFTPAWQYLFHYIYLLESLYTCVGDPSLEYLMLKNVGGLPARGYLDILKDSSPSYEIVSKNKHYLKDGTYKNVLKQRKVEPFYISSTLADRLQNGNQLISSGATIPPLLQGGGAALFDRNGNKKVYSPGNNAVIFMNSFNTAPTNWLETWYDEEASQEKVDASGYAGGPADAYLDVILWTDAAARDNEENRNNVLKIIYRELGNPGGGNSDEYLQNADITGTQLSIFEIFVEQNFVELTLDEAQEVLLDDKGRPVNYFINGTKFTDHPIYLWSWGDDDKRFLQDTYFTYLAKSYMFNDLDASTGVSMRELSGDAASQIWAPSRREKFIEFIDEFHVVSKEQAIKALQYIICDHYRKNYSGKGLGSSTSFKGVLSKKALQTLVLKHCFHGQVSESDDLFVLKQCGKQGDIAAIRTSISKLEMSDTNEATAQEIGGQVVSLGVKEVTINSEDIESSVSLNSLPNSNTLSPIVTTDQIDTSNKSEDDSSIDFVNPFGTIGEGSQLLVISPISIANSGLRSKIVDQYGTIWNQGNSAIDFIIKDTKGGFRPDPSKPNTALKDTLFPYFDEDGNSLPYSKKYTTLTYISSCSTLYIIPPVAVDAPKDSPESVILVKSARATDLKNIENINESTWEVLYNAFEAEYSAEDQGGLLNSFGGNVIAFNIPDIGQGSMITDRSQFITSDNKWTVVSNSVQKNNIITDKGTGDDPITDVTYDTPSGEFEPLDEPEIDSNEPYNWFVQDGYADTDPYAQPSAKVIIKNVADDQEVSSEEFENIKAGKLIGPTEVTVDLFDPLSDEQVVSQTLANSGLLLHSQFSYVRPKSPEKTGVLYIGDILFHIPPVNLRFTLVNQAVSIPSMRTKGDPIHTTNNNIPKVEITLYFKGQEQINNTLRPLVALSQTIPSTSVQNTTIYDAWIGRQESEVEDGPIDKFSPIPCYLESINFSTVPGFPDTIQAYVTLVQMDMSSMIPSLRYWRYTADALNQAIDKGTRQAMDSTILHIKDKSKSSHTKGTTNDSEIKVLTSVGQLLTIKVPDTIAGLDGDKVTIYPQESFPFKKTYRNRLLEEEHTYSRTVKDPGIHWNLYDPSHNENLYITYRSPRFFNDEYSLFMSRFDDLMLNFNFVKIIFMTAEGDFDQAISIREVFKSSKSFSLYDTLEAFIGNLSWMKDWDNMITIFNKYWRSAVISGSKKFTHDPLFINFPDGTSINVRDYAGEDGALLPYVDSDGNISEDVKPLLDALEGRFLEDIQIDKLNNTTITKNWRDADWTPDDGKGKKIPPSMEFIQIIIDGILMDSMFDDSFPSNPLNYETVQVQLGWNEEISNEAKTAIELLDQRARFPGMTEATKKERGQLTRFAFQSVIQSISYSYTNNAVPFFMISSPLPTYQHTGTSNALVSVSLKTRDERLLKIIADMRNASKAIGAQVMRGDASLMGYDSLRISGSNSKFYSGHLLNSLGIKLCNITSIETRSIEGYPGWWEVNIDFVENNTLIRSWENLSLAPSIDSSLINKLKKELFRIPSAIPSGVMFKDSINQRGKGKEIKVETLDTEFVSSSAGISHSVSTGFKAQLELPISPPIISGVDFGDDWDIPAEAVLEHITDELVKQIIKIPTGVPSSNFNVTGYIPTVSSVQNSGVKKAKFSEGMFNIDFSGLVLSGPEFGGQNAVANLKLYRETPNEDGELPENGYYTSEVAIRDKWVYSWSVQGAKKKAKKSHVLLNHNQLLAPWLLELAELTFEMTTYDRYLRDNDKAYPSFVSEITGLPDRTINFGLKSAVVSSIGRIIELAAGAVDGVIQGLIKTSVEEVKSNLIDLVKIHGAGEMDGTTYREWVRKFIKYGEAAAKFDWDKSTGGAVLSKGLRHHITKGLFLDPMSASVDFSADSLTVHSGMLSNEQLTQLKPVLRRHDFRAFVDTHLALFGYTNDTKPDLVKLYTSLYRSVTPNYPDLNIPDVYLTNTGTQLISPTFAFADFDPDFEIIEMERALNTLRTAISTQIAAVWGGINVKEYNTIQSYFIKDGQNSPMFEAALETVKQLDQNQNGTTKRGLTVPSWLCAPDTPKQFRRGEASINQVKATSIFGLMDDLGKRIEEEQNSSPTLPPEALTKPLTKGYEGIAKDDLMKIMTTAALLDYVITIMAVSPYTLEPSEAAKWIDPLGNDDFKTAAVALADHVSKFWDPKATDSKSNRLSRIFKNVILVDGAAVSTTGDVIVPGIQIENDVLAKRAVQLLLQKRNKVASMLTIASTGDWSAFNSFMGIGNTDGDWKKTELLTKFKEYMQTKRRGSMDRVYPTFKIFVLEEDSTIWSSFDDFYTYDAASEISIVESKHAASKTAILKLSNVSGKLTGKPFNDLIAEGFIPLPGENINIKIGAEIIVFLGYGADYKQLRMKFRGAITELNSGPILEITAQSWGAGLLNPVGSAGGLKHTSMNGASTLSAVVIDILNQTPGLGKLGRWQLKDWDGNHSSGMGYTAFKRIYYARALNSAIGWIPRNDFLPNTNIGEILGGFFDEEDGLPTTPEGYQEKYNQNDMIVRSMGNSLFENIVVNNSNLDGYGLFNWASKALNLDFTKGFDWHIYAQSAWDALHEVALFMGDYIITTLPYNEGNNVFDDPPRETLYFGPREHLYKASSYNPALNTKDVFAEIIRDYNNSKQIMAKAPELIKGHKAKLDDALDKLKLLEEGRDERSQTKQSIETTLSCNQWKTGWDENGCVTCDEHTASLSTGAFFTISYTIPGSYNANPGASGATFVYVIPQQDRLDKDQRGNPDVTSSTNPHPYGSATLLYPGHEHSHVHVLGDVVYDFGHTASSYEGTPEEVIGWAGAIEMTSIKARDSITKQPYDAEVFIGYPEVGGTYFPGFGPSGPTAQYIELTNLPSSGATVTADQTYTENGVEIFAATGDWYQWNVEPFSSSDIQFDPSQYYGAGRILITPPEGKIIENITGVFIDGVEIQVGGATGDLAYSGGNQGYKLIPVPDIIGPTAGYGPTHDMPNGINTWRERSYIVEIYDTPTVFLYDERSKDLPDIPGVRGPSGYTGEKRSGTWLSDAYKTTYKVATADLNIGCSYARYSSSSNYTYNPDDYFLGSRDGWRYNINPGGDIEVDTCTGFAGSDTYDSVEDCVEAWNDDNANTPGSWMEHSYTWENGHKANIKIPRSPWYHQYLVEDGGAVPLKNIVIDNDQAYLSRCGFAITNDWLKEKANPHESQRATMRTDQTTGSDTWYADEEIWDWLYPNNYPASVIESNGNLNFPYFYQPVSSQPPYTDDWVVTGNNSALWNSYFTLWRTSDWTGEGLVNNLLGHCTAMGLSNPPNYTINPALDIPFAGFTMEGGPSGCIAEGGVWIPSSNVNSPLYHEGTPLINQDVAHGRIDYLNNTVEFAQITKIQSNNCESGQASCHELFMHNFPDIICSEHSSISGVTGPDCAGNCWGTTGMDPGTLELWGSTGDECEVCRYPGCTSVGTPPSMIINPCPAGEHPGNPDWNSTCLDCDGNPNSGWFMNKCGDCVEPGSTGETMCIRHCNGRYYYTDNTVSESTEGFFEGDSRQGWTGPTYDSCGQCMWPQGSGHEDPSLVTWIDDPNFKFWGGSGTTEVGFGFGFDKPCADCAGEPGGTAVYDRCDQCVGATTGGTYAADTVTACTRDCLGVWGGSAEFDLCGRCDGVVQVDPLDSTAGATLLPRSVPVNSGEWYGNGADCANYNKGINIWYSDGEVFRVVCGTDGSTNNLYGDCGANVVPFVAPGGIGAYLELDAINGDYWVFYAVYNEANPLDPLADPDKLCISDQYNTNIPNCSFGNPAHGGTYASEIEAVNVATTWWEDLSGQTYEAGWAWYAAHPVLGTDMMTEPCAFITHSYWIGAINAGGTSVYGASADALAAAYDWWENEDLNVPNTRRYGLVDSPFGDCSCYDSNNLNSEISDCAGNCFYGRGMTAESVTYDNCVSGECTAGYNDCGVCDISGPTYTGSAFLSYDWTTPLTGSCYDCSGEYHLVGEEWTINRCGHCGPDDGSDAIHDGCEMTCDGEWHTRVLEDDSDTARENYYDTAFYADNYEARNDWCDICHPEGPGVDTEGWDWGGPSFDVSCTWCDGYKAGSPTAFINECGQCVSYSDEIHGTCAPQGTTGCHKKCDGTWEVASGTGEWAPHMLSEIQTGCNRPVFNITPQAPQGVTADNIDNCGVCGGTGAPFGMGPGLDLTLFGCGCESACAGDLPWETRFVYEARYANAHSVTVNYQTAEDFIDEELQFEFEIDYHVKEKCAQFKFDVPSIPPIIGNTNAAQSGFISVDPNSTSMSTVINPSDYAHVSNAQNGESKSQASDWSFEPHEVKVDSTSRYTTDQSGNILETLSSEEMSNAELSDFNPPVAGATTGDLIYSYFLKSRVVRSEDTTDFLGGNPTSVNYWYYFKEGQNINVDFNVINHIAASPEQIDEVNNTIEEITNNIDDVNELVEMQLESQKEMLLLAKHSIAKIIKEMFKFRDTGMYSYKMDEWPIAVNEFVTQLEINGFNKYAAVIKNDTLYGYTQADNDLPVPKKNIWNKETFYTEGNIFSSTGGRYRQGGFFDEQGGAAEARAPWEMFLEYWETDRTAAYITDWMVSHKNNLSVSVGAGMWTEAATYFSLTMLEQFTWKLSNHQTTPTPFSYAKFHEIFCGDYEKNFIDKTLMNPGEIEEHTGSMLSYIDEIRALSDDSVKNSQWMDSRVTVPDNVTAGGFYHPDNYEEDPGFEVQFYGGTVHEAHYINTGRSISSLGALQQLLPMHYVVKLLAKQDEAMKDDLMEIMKSQIEGKAHNLEAYDPSKLSPILLEMENMIREVRGLNEIFSYKSVVQHHLVDSYNDIIDNNIVATADEMYNHVKITYMSEPVSREAAADTSKFYETEAMISYDQDPDYLRTYQTFVKNMDPNYFKRFSDANAYLGTYRASQGYDETELQASFTPEASEIAQQVLRNMMKPMYQGTLTLIGNANIRPWDVVYIYDDATDMHGPVEVEQVVNTLTAGGGYFTTIIPNLLVYEKDSMRGIEEELINIFQRFGMIKSVMGGFWHAMGIGVGYWGYRYVARKIKESTNILAGVSKAVQSTEILKRASAARGVVGTLAPEFAAATEYATALGDSKKYEDGLKTLKKRYKSYQKEFKWAKTAKSQAAIKKDMQLLKVRLKKKILESNRLKKVVAKKLTKAVGKRGLMSAGVGSVFGWAAAAWGAWEIIQLVFNAFTSYGESQIHLAQVLAGENKLTWVPLRYKGEEYVAGLEGIVGSPRSSTTILHGELKGKEGDNRSINVVGKFLDIDDNKK